MNALREPDADLARRGVHAVAVLSCVVFSACSLTLSFDDLSSGETSSGGADAGAESGDAGEGELAVNCLDPANVLHPKCVPVHHATPGSVGGGVVMPWGPGGADMFGGFVDGARVVMALDGADDDGALLGVDLATGDRTVLSGKVHDAAALVHERGAGPSLAHVSDVGRLHDGAWLAITSTLPQQLIRVDPTSGDRTLWHSWSTMSCTRPDTSADSIDVVPPNGMSAKLETAADGAVYFPVENTAEDGIGIARWGDGSCSMVSYHSNLAPENAVGTGPSMLWMIRDLRAWSNSLYVVAGGTQALVRVDIATGDRFIVSRSDPPLVGAGSARVGRDSVAPAGDRVWTVGPLDNVQFVLSEIDPSSGDRIGHGGMSGPVYDVFASYPQVWLHPSRPLLILELGDGLVLYDPATDNNNLLSY